MNITRSQGNLMWTNVTHHIHVTFLTLLIPFFNAFYNKELVADHNFSMFDFSIKHLKLFITTVHVCVLYLCDTSMYIYTIYILTYTKICTQDLMEMYKSFNDQNIS
jgi:hypothetical protein